MRFRFLPALALTLTLLFSQQGCVESFEPGLSLNADVLTVDGTLTDSPDPQVLRISRTRSLPRRNPEVLPVPGAQVWLVADGGPPLRLPEVEPGRYALPTGRVGSRYRLRFETPDGQQYESSEEPLLATPPIDALRATFDPLALPDPTDATPPQPGHRLYLDTTDPPGARHYYRWTWTLWEKQPWCVTCRQGRLWIQQDPVTGRTISQRCQEQPWRPITQYFDYRCQDDCWDIVRTSEIFVGSDAFGDGRPLLNNAVGIIPLYQSSGCLVEVRQMALSQQAHEFYRLLQTQAQTTGTLADTPPAPPIGNIRNISQPTQPVAGYFAAGAVTTQLLFIDRNDVGSTPPLLGGLLGHPVIVEPYEPPPPGVFGEGRPPFALCTPSLTRTPVRPVGWPP
jgi:hypothetical protein